MSSCDKIEVDRTEFEETEPGFFKFTGTLKCKNCGRAFHEPSIKIIKAASAAAAAAIFGGNALH